MLLPVLFSFFPQSFTFTCGLCPCEFNNRWQLTQHRGKAHRQNDGQYVCEECGKTTAKVRDMIIHKRGRHNTTFCTIYSIKNNNVNQSIPSKGHQENSQLSLQENGHDRTRICSTTKLKLCDI